MHTLKPTAASSLSLSPGNYIYSITASSPGSFAAISSDDSLRLFDADLSHVSVVASQSHADGVTSLETYGSGDQQLLATGGRDGKVKLWDLRCRNGSPVAELGTESNAPILSVACNPRTNSVVAGTELASHQAVVAFWDIRTPEVPRLQYIESHNDDITELQYHPTQDHVLLSGSTDGLVNIYNTTIADEDDALLQVINHGSVHHAGFLTEKTVYALSHDEDFSIHPLTDPDDETQEPDPVQFGDLREPLGCEYIAQLCVGGQGPYIAAGNKINKQLDLVPLSSTPSWHFEQNDLWRLPGAHGDEVIRSVYLDEQTQSVFTGGEDGLVRVWKAGDAGDAEASAAKPPRKEKKREKERFKPY